MRVSKVRLVQILGLAVSLFMSGNLNSGGLNSNLPQINVKIEAQITMHKTVIRDSFNTTNNTNNYYLNSPEK